MSSMANSTMGRCCEPAGKTGQMVDKSPNPTDEDRKNRCLQLVLSFGIQSGCGVKIRILRLV